MSELNPVAATPAAEAKKPNFLDQAMETLRTADRRNLVAWGLAIAGMFVMFFPLFRRLPDLWFAADTYYGHGVIVPFCAGLIIADRWGKISKEKVKPAYWMIVPIMALSYVMWVAAGNSTRTLMSLAFIPMLLSVALFLFGFAVWKHLIMGLSYVTFALPVWDGVIDRYTQPLQRVSTDTSYTMLKLAGQNPLRHDSTLVYLDQFELYVGAPCSGLKLMLAVIAIVVFFALIAKLKWWGNVILLATAVPLCLIINGLRITMIGLVGNQMGRDAGHAFHDSSGFISLIICFLVLMKLTKLLGWK
jgi:exosortase